MLGIKRARVGKQSFRIELSVRKFDQGYRVDVEPGHPQTISKSRPGHTLEASRCKRDASLKHAWDIG